MQALTVAGPGGPEVLSYKEAVAPEPGPADALVRVAAAGVNYIDVYMRRAGQTPVVGMEGAGTIERLGPEAAALGLAVGDRVAWAMQAGSYAELAVVPGRLLVPVPGDVELTTAAAAMLQGLTAEYLVADSYAVRPGDVALVHAAAGGVGRLLCQLIAAKGARAIGTVSTDEKAEIARAAGAHETIRYDREDFATRARELTDGRGVDVVYDAVNRATFRDSLRALRRAGTLVLYGEASGQTDPLPPKELQAAGSVKLTYPSLAHFVAEREELLARAARLFEHLRDGTLRLELQTRPLADGAAAHADLEGRRTTGKLVLVP